MGFLEILTLVFVLCKLGGIVDWSWWIVLAPEIVAVGLYGLVVALYALAGRSLLRELRKGGPKW